MRRFGRSFSSFNRFHPHGQGGFGRTRRHATFDPSFLVKKAESNQIKTEYTPRYSFGDFQIHDQLKRNISARGYTKLTPIQDQAIPHILAGRDVVGIANTGTGKTAAFLVPLINKVVTTGTSRVLIVAPTRELAVQVQQELKIFGSGLRLFSTLCIGGASLHFQMRDLERNPQFVVGTPGRLKDLEQRGRLQFGSFDTVVLDEVDRMLDMGFIRDVGYIIARLPRQRHSLFFSATIPQKVRELMQGFITNPVTIAVASPQAAENVDQDIVRMNGKPKIEVLHELLIREGFEKVLVFGRTKWGMEKLTRELDRRGFKVAAIHGNKSQNQRQRALQLFKDGAVKVLLATDVASRGLDIDNVTHVINFDLPQTQEDYIHRVGRTGRADKKGTALSFVE